VPDKRTHRGAHPEDGRLFAPQWHEALRRATSDLSWLLSREYATPSALKIVGDRFALDARQRTAVMRCACSDAARDGRMSRMIPPTALRGQTLLIDGYNVLTTIEVALGGGVILVARDGTYRDMASMHGSYRKVEETVPALELIGQTLSNCGIDRATWFLDQPVSNSGRLKTVMAEVAEKHGWNWDIQIVPNPDAVLSSSSEIVASADSAILDACQSWVNLARLVIERHLPWRVVVNLSTVSESGGNG
jgi:hypothetical protein